MVAIPSVLSSLYAASAASSLYPFSWLNVANCNVSNQVANIDFPQNQTTLVPPSNLTLNHIGIAFGVQNYTCSESNNFTSVGAVAQLIDASCFAASDRFHQLPDQLYKEWVAYNGSSIQDLISGMHVTNPPEVLAQHYFVTNPTTGQGVSPKWDFTSSGKFDGNSDAFIVAKGKATLPAPTNATTDVAWLDVVNVEGKIADEVFRTDTRGGQPPATCEFNKTLSLSVKYVSFYYFFGGSLNTTTNA